MSSPGPALSPEPAPRKVRAQSSLRTDPRFNQVPTDEYAPVVSISSGKRLRNRAHEQMMEDYYSARDAWLKAREAVALGYATEEQEFAANHPRPLLRDFMRNRERAS